MHLGSFNSYRDIPDGAIDGDTATVNGSEARFVGEVDTYAVNMWLPKDIADRGLSYVTNSDGAPSRFVGSELKAKPGARRYLGSEPGKLIVHAEDAELPPGWTLTRHKGDNQ